MGNSFLYPEKPAKVDWSIYDCHNHYPKYAELMLMKAGDFREVEDDQDKENTLANRVQNLGRNQTTMPSNQENKVNYGVMEFSMESSSGYSRQPSFSKQHNGLGKRTTMSNSSRYNTAGPTRQNKGRNIWNSRKTNNKGLKVKPTKSSQVREMMNRDKGKFWNNRAMSTIREDPRGKLN